MIASRSVTWPSTATVSAVLVTAIVASSWRLSRCSILGRKLRILLAFVRKCRRVLREVLNNTVGTPWREEFRSPPSKLLPGGLGGRAKSNMSRQEKQAGREA